MKTLREFTSQPRRPHCSDLRNVAVQRDRLETGWKDCLPILLAAILIAMCCRNTQAAPGEYEVKAAFVHNIAKFVEWPVSATESGVVRLCILGQEAFADAAVNLQGKPVGSRVWEVVHASSRTELRSCQVLFIGASEAANLPHLLAGIKSNPVLTVGDSEGYAAQGVMVNFYLEQNKVRFEINLAAASRAGLKISSQLLKLARITQPSRGEE